MPLYEILGLGLLGCCVGCLEPEREGHSEFAPKPGDFCVTGLSKDGLFDVAQAGFCHGLLVLEVFQTLAGG